MFGSISHAIGFLIDLAQAIIWGTISGIASTNAGIVLLTIAAIAVAMLLYRAGAALLRPTKEELK